MVTTPQPIYCTGGCDACAAAARELGVPLIVPAPESDTNANPKTRGGESRRESAEITPGLSREAALEDAISILASAAEEAAEFPLDQSLVAALAEKAEAAREAIGDRIDFLSYDGAVTIRTGQGKDCVMIQFIGEQSGGVVLLVDEAEALGASLLRRARYSRRAE